jgi:hypothetical protein
MIHKYSCEDGCYFEADSSEVQKCPLCGYDSVTWIGCRTGEVGVREDKSCELYRDVQISTQEDHKKGHYEAKDRVFHPAMMKGVTPEQYQRVQEKAFAEKQDVASRVAELRRGTSRADDEGRKVGSIPLAQFLARKAEVGGDFEQVQDKEYWKKQGRIFSHESV